VAYIVGLQPGIAVQVPIVVVAEDGVTSNRFPPPPPISKVLVTSWEGFMVYQYLYQPDMKGNTVTQTV